MAFQEVPRLAWSLQVMFVPPHVVQGTWSVAITTVGTAGGICASNFLAAAVNDQAAIDIDISGGTWTLGAMMAAGAGYGVTTFAISYDKGATWTTLGTYDGYSASNALKQALFTGIVVPEGVTSAQLRMTIASKNASSTGYAASISQVALLRTAG